MSQALDQSHVLAEDADSAYAETLRTVLEHGSDIQAGSSQSIGSKKSSREILNFSCVISQPRRRLPLNPARKVNLPAAVARFVWMMAGSDRLADIAFYEPKVRSFSDDGIAVPGSSYGQRILRPRPGLNQLESAIARLKQEPASRRAAISIYHPEDAVRESRDIPCAFGIFYHIREGGLAATTLMRSNNAYILLPYNIFEFSLLAEAVAVEIGVPLKTLCHTAISMHVYAHDLDAAAKVVGSFDSWSPQAPPQDFPAIPTGSSPLQAIRELVILEADLRHESAGLSGKSIEEWITRGGNKLDAYWRQQFFLLLLYVAKRNQDGAALLALESVIEEPWRSYLDQEYFRAATDSAQSAAQLLELEQPGIAHRPPTIVPLHSTRMVRSLRKHASAWERAGAERITWQEFANLEERFSMQLAASADDSDLTEDEFNQALSEIRSAQ